MMFEHKTEPQKPDQTGDHPLRQLTLNKGSEKFVFRYRLGDEEALLDAMIDQAKSGRTSFDWFDAAVLSFQLTQELIAKADKLLEKD
jgi:hypothetical protein